jgi:hypothetical protein
MTTKMNESENMMFKVYYLLTLMYGIFSIISVIYKYLNHGNSIVLLSLISQLFSITVIISSIYVLRYFKKMKFDRISIILPVYHIVIFCSLLAFAFLNWFLILQGSAIDKTTLLIGLTLFGITTSLFEVIFSGYIIHRFLIMK